MKLEEYLRLTHGGYYNYCICPICGHHAGDVSLIHKSFSICTACTYVYYEGISTDITSKNFLKSISTEESPILRGVLALKKSHDIDKRKELVIRNLKELFDLIEKHKTLFHEYMKEHKDEANRDLVRIISMGSILTPMLIWDDIRHRHYWNLPESFDECMKIIDDIVDKAYKMHEFTIDKELTRDEEDELIEKYHSAGIDLEKSWLSKLDIKNKKIHHVVLRESELENKFNSFILNFEKNL